MVRLRPFGPSLSLPWLLLAGRELREVMHQMLTALALFGSVLVEVKETNLPLFRRLNNDLLVLVLMLEWLLMYEDVANRYTWTKTDQDLGFLLVAKEKGFRFVRAAAQNNLRVVRCPTLCVCTPEL